MITRIGTSTPTGARDLYVSTEPSHEDLCAIADEWPVIEAELEVVAAECRLARFPGDQVAVRAHRRAVRAVLALLTGSTAHPNPNPLAPGDRPDAA